MIRLLALVAFLCVCAVLLAPTTASAVCGCYKHGRYMRCEPSPAACRAVGGDHCVPGDCRREF